MVKIGGIYVEFHPKEEGMIRTRYARYDPIVGKYIQHQPTNWHRAEPTPEMSHGITELPEHLRPCNQHLQEVSTDEWDIRYCRNEDG